MINFTKGDLLNSDCQALVNTVNCVGVMGKGIAFQFKKTFPENFRQYKEACDKGEVFTGRMFVTQHKSPFYSIWIVNFPTKEHWRNSSNIEWIRDGLIDLRLFIEDNHIESIAIPPLGCGNGGLNWIDIKALIIDILGYMKHVNIMVYEPDQWQN